MNKFNLFKWLMLIVVVLYPAACGGGAQDGDVVGEDGVNWGTLEPPEAATAPPLSYTITSEGSGEASIEPLDPLIPGQLLTVSGNLPASRVVAGNIRLGELEVREIWYSKDRFERGAATWELNTGDGLVRYGCSDDGVFRQALLLAPATVRQGMTWSQGGTDFEVGERKLEVTPWGDLPVWTINQNLDGEPACSRTYVEGHGLRSDTCALTGPVDGAIELLDEQASPEVQAQPLQPLAVGGLPFVMDTAASNLWALDPQPGVRPMVITVDGSHRPDFFSEYMDDKTRRCLEVTPDGKAFERGFIALGGDYSYTENRILRGPATCPARMMENGELEELHDRHAAYTWMSGDGKGGLWYGPGSDDGGLKTDDGRVNSVSMVALVDFGTGIPSAVYWNTIANYVWELAKGLCSQLVGGDPEAALSSLTANEDGSLNVGLIMPGGVLANALIDAAGYFQGVANGPFVGPFRSVRMAPTGRDVLLVSPGGAIDRLEFTGDTWQRQPLVNVQLPKDAWGVVGAFSLGGSGNGRERLLVATRSFPGLKIFEDGELVEELPNPSSRLYTVEVPQAAPSRPWLSGLGVTAEKLGGDVRVCWESSEEPSLEGWTLGAAAALGVIPHFADHHCAAVFRDPAAALSPEEPGGMVVEGPVPGVGRMRVALSPGVVPPRVDFQGGAPLAGGGFVAAESYFGTILFGEGGITLGPVPVDDPYATFLEDLGGHGLWVMKTREPEPGLFIVDQQGFHLVGDAAAMVQGVGGGGVLVETVHGLALVELDGTRTELDMDPLRAMNGLVVTPDRTICGYVPDLDALQTRTFVRCVFQNGEVKEIPWEINYLSLPSEDYPLHWPLPDGRIVITDFWGEATWVLDPQTMTLEQLVPGLLDSPVLDAEGRLYARVDTEWSEVTGDGLVPLDLGEQGRSAAGLAVDEDYFILFLGEGGLLRLRR